MSTIFLSMESLMNINRVLFLTKLRNDSYAGPNDYVNKTFGLTNSANFISNWLNKYGLVSKVITCVDANEIDRLVYQFNPDMVILEALWVPPAKLKEIATLPHHKGRVWIVRLHSKPSFIANEGVAFEWIEGYKAITPWVELYTAPNNMEFAQDLNRLFHTPSVYLPNIYYTGYEKHFRSRKIVGDTIDIGCFGAIRPLKNHLTQAIAAVKFGLLTGKKINFHINADRVEQRGDAVLKNLRSFFQSTKVHTLVEHPWVSHETFINLVYQMELGTQVSFTETFDIVAADFVSCGVPVVVSEEVAWMPDSFKVKNPTSTTEICNKMIYAMKAYRRRLRNTPLTFLGMHNEIAKQAWLKFLEQF